MATIDCLLPARLCMTTLLSKFLQSDEPTMAELIPRAPDIEGELPTLAIDLSSLFPMGNRRRIIKIDQIISKTRDQGNG